jgi:hypothetical protein
MRVFLTGATGFLGRALTLALRRGGHAVSAWVRSPERARALLGDQAELCPVEGGETALRAELGRCDAVVHLAGAPVLARWTSRRRRELRASRVDLTERVVDALAHLERRPRVLLSASAVGFYGDAGPESCGEASPPGQGFLAELCADWEAAARRAEGLGLRVVRLRTGVVLGLDGGALPALLTPFRLGLGGRLGSGRQFLPWIHVEDWVRIVQLALTDERASGALNLTAPEPATNRELTATLARVLAKPAFLPVPAAAVRALLGGGAEVLLASQRAQPERALALGFEHAFPTLDAALRDLLVDGRVEIARLDGGRGSTSSPYLTARPARYGLVAATELAVPRDEAFRFFSRAENLGLLTPRPMGLSIVASSGPPETGTTIDYVLRVGPLPLRWRTRFEAWQAPERFVDVQERGPYRAWWHEHRFEACGATTRMHDRVLYAPPLGPLGALAQRLFLADALGDLFAQRALAIRLRFGRGERAAQSQISVDARAASARR